MEGVHKMRKRNLGIISVAMATMMMLSACGGGTAGQTSESGSEAESYMWKMALNSTAGDNAYDVGAIFAEKVEELTDGRVKVELYGGASLGSTSEILEGMQYGVADIMVESIGTLSTFSELANIDAVPYLYGSYEHFMDVWNSELGDEIKQTIGDDAGFKLLGSTFRGPRIVTSTKKMETFEDFAGFKLRAPNLDVYIKTWQWMKAAPTPLAMGEVYTALQQKTVEGQENPMNDSLNYAFNEVCKYWIKTNHVYSNNVVIMEKNYFDGLPTDIQQAVEEAANYAGNEISRAQLEKEEIAEQKLIELGCEVIEIDIDDFVSKFDGFVETNYPNLVDWATQIQAMNS